MEISGVGNLAQAVKAASQNIEPNTNSASSGAQPASDQVSSNLSAESTEILPATPVAQTDQQESGAQNDPQSNTGSQVDITA